MKYKEAYKQINAIMKLTSQDEIIPLADCDDDSVQLAYLKDSYLERYLKAFPQWKKFKNRPEAINDIGMQLLVKATCKSCQ